MAERTGCPFLFSLWSYVAEKLLLWYMNRRGLIGYLVIGIGSLNLGTWNLEFGNWDLGLCTAGSAEFLLMGNIRRHVAICEASTGALA
jgi:hypothetical protein